MRHLSSAVELVGLALIVTAAWLWTFEAGLAATGAVLVLLGMVADRTGR
jgi:hypothetical protein